MFLCGQTLSNGPSEHHTVKTCVGAARTNACHVTALSASNTPSSEYQKGFAGHGSQSRQEFSGSFFPLPPFQNIGGR